MNRTIKFRVLDRINPKWIYFSLEGLVEADKFNKSLPHYKFGIWNQFTGLFDKNGMTEVYEGDIFTNEGKIIGNLYETAEVYERGINYFVANLCTSAWRDTEEKLLGYGFKYAE